DGEVNVSSFEGVFPREEILAMAGKVTYTPQEGTEFPRGFPGRLEISVKSGKVLKASVSDVKGSPSRPLTTEEIRRKFEINALTRLTPKAAADVVGVVDRLEEMSNLTSLSGTLGQIK
ncbi:MAG: MmgE/PrpD family protein, partial [Deltaproteobacteria bacterium]|nr:MmgE/PrpD family protein [Deltaproteobacteria bacterium]